jgi:hypothetical protein
MTPFNNKATNDMILLNTRMIVWSVNTALLIFKLRVFLYINLSKANIYVNFLISQLEIIYVKFENHVCDTQNQTNFKTLDDDHVDGVRLCL